MEKLRVNLTCLAIWLVITLLKPCCSLPTIEFLGKQVKENTTIWVEKRSFNVDCFSSGSTKSTESLRINCHEENGSTYEDRKTIYGRDKLHVRPLQFVNSIRCKCYTYHKDGHVENVQVEFRYTEPTHPIIEFLGKQVMDKSTIFVQERSVNIKCISRRTTEIPIKVVLTCKDEYGHHYQFSRTSSYYGDDLVLDRTMYFIKGILCECDSQYRSGLIKFVWVEFKYRDHIGRPDDLSTYDVAPKRLLQDLNQMIGRVDQTAIFQRLQNQPAFDALDNIIRRIHYSKTTHVGETILNAMDNIMECCIDKFTAQLSRNVISSIERLASGIPLTGGLFRFNSKPFGMMVHNLYQKQFVPKRHRSIFLDEELPQNGHLAVKKSKNRNSGSTSVDVPTNALAPFLPQDKNNRLVVIVYKDGGLFERSIPNMGMKIVSKVVTVKVPGVTIETLTEDVTLTFHVKKVTSSPQCKYWHLGDEGNGNKTSTKWESDGCTMLESFGHSVTCSCNHLTSFALVVTDGDSKLAVYNYSLTVFCLLMAALYQ